MMDDTHPDKLTLHTGAARPHSGFVENLYFISPRTGNRSKVFETQQAFSFISLESANRAGDDASIYSSWLIGFPSGVKRGEWLNGLVLLESRGAPSPW
jgi:hypothetical protein